MTSNNNSAAVTGSCTGNSHDLSHNPAHLKHLSSHLEDQYGIRVHQLTELGQDVFRIDRHDGPSWVARMFPPGRTMNMVEGDAEILNFLKQNDFLAERCAHARAVSTHEERCVLVTEFIEGPKVRASEWTFQTLGDLLGRLHSLPYDTADVTRKGGGWHHMCYYGGPKDEISAAMSMLAGAASQVPAEHRELFEGLRDELEKADDFEDLPMALTHPDFVPANVIKSSNNDLIAIDWAGAGRGPRISSLGFLLWAAGSRGVEQVNAVVAGYSSHIRLESLELERMCNAIVARSLIFNCWAFCMGEKKLDEVIHTISAARLLADEIAKQARHAFQVQDSQVNARGTQGKTQSALLHGVGETGLAVAAIRAEETRRPDRLFSDDLAGAFVAASNWTSKRLKGDPRTKALKFWIVARTVFFDELILNACRDGCQQIVLLGAGFDARSFRLPWPNGICCFEMDTANVLDSKAQVLTQQGSVATCKRIPVCCDLREDWPAALLTAGFEPQKRTAWLAEGLVMYLTREEVDRLLANITRLSATGSRLGLDMSTREPNADDKIRYANLRRSTAPEKPIPWFASYGWTAQLADALEVLRAHGRLGTMSNDGPRPGSADERTRKAFMISAIKDQLPDFKIDDS